MRVFQNSALYAAYRPRLTELTRDCRTFATARDAFLADRFGACHFLEPVLGGAPEAFFTNGDDPTLQGLWAQEQGMAAKSTLGDILLAQIEEHRADVFYNLDPVRYGSNFVQRLPACVKRAIAWRAAPSPQEDFSAYDLLVCNFPGILRGYEERGWRAAYFTPAHDPVMDAYSENANRPVDVLFVGGYSRHHRRRAEIMEAVATELTDCKVTFRLDRSRLTCWSEAPWGRLLPLGRHRRPPEIRNVSREPVFGLKLYEELSRAKIVLNGAVDMAGMDRGNMRCFEALGCGAMMVSDAGQYPAGMVDGQSLLTYRNAREAVSRLREMLADPGRRLKIAACGNGVVSNLYSKKQQWNRFMQLCDGG